MNYHFAICDDELTQQSNLKQLVQRWATANKYTVNIQCFPSAESFLFQYSEDKSYDILLLDIEMGAMNGIELAKTIRQSNKQIQIVFVTGYMEYISDGYDVEALHYLLKPVTESKFFDVLNRAAIRLKRNEQVLLLDLSNEHIRIPLYEIRYLEAQRNYATIYADKDYTIKTTLSELEKKLDNNFFRTGRSYIINLNYIRRILKTEIHLSDDTILPLPRGQYHAINRAMIDKL